MSRERTLKKPRVESKHDLCGSHIVLIDQGPLRETAAANCTNAMTRLDRARIEWHRFERKDKPAFVRWQAREFGALLSRARDVEVQIRDNQTLIHEIEMEMRRGFQDAHSAYQRVMFRRANPHAAPVEQTETPRKGDRGSQKLSDFEKEALFHDWVKKSLGTNPDKLDDEVYSTTFEAFKSHMFRSPLEKPRPTYTNRPRARKRIEAESEEKEEEERKVDERVKQLYRILVRRLHPDLRADASTAVSALWHEVQEAYAASDVPRMEILLALSDIESNHMGSQTSISQMRAVLAELDRASRAWRRACWKRKGKTRGILRRPGLTRSYGCELSGN